MPIASRAALIALLALLSACQREGPDAQPPSNSPAISHPEPDAAADASPIAASPEPAAPDLGPPEPPLPTGGRARLRFSPTAPLEMGNQLDPLYRRLGTDGSRRRKGSFYIEFCSKPGCRDPRLVRVNRKTFGPYGSVNGPRGEALTVGGVPGRAAPWHVRIFLDTAYSQAVGAGVEATGGASAFDVYASGGALDGMRCATAADCVGGRLTGRQNPDPITFEVTLTDGATTDLGRVIFGHIVADLDTPQPAPGDGHVLVAATGTHKRNAIYAIDERDQRVAPAGVAQVDGKPFVGELCGFVRGAGSDLWVLGTAARGGHVFRYDTRRRAFVDQPPLVIPPPSRGGGPVALCRGVHLRSTDSRGQPRSRLVLIEFRGAGARDVVEAWPMAVVDVTDPRAPSVRPIAAGEGPFGRGGASPVLRGIATDGTHVFALAPSWRSGGDGQSALYTMALDPESGAPAIRHTVAAGVADDRCGSTLHFAPALAVAAVHGAPRVFVGTDTGLDVYDPAALAAGRADAPVDRLDLTGYGVLPTSAAVSPDARRLYVMPNCKSRYAASLGGVAATRHAVAIVDLDSDPNAPALLHGDRRFDDPGGGPTGGVDLAYLSLKRAALRWSPQAVLPPIAYTGPQIVAGSTALYLRGAGISLGREASAELRAAGISGLGQAGDVAVLNLATGQGTTSRAGYRLWFDGPSAAWGIDLQPGDRGASTGALVRIGGR